MNERSGSLLHFMVWRSSSDVPGLLMVDWLLLGWEIEDQRVRIGLLSAQHRGEVHA